MKIQELFEKIDLSTSTPIQFRNGQWLPISGELAGKGIQARVYNTGQGMVTKVAVLDEEKGINDNAVKFLDLVLQHQDNPFFPKIYHARIYRDKEGVRNPILVVQMEKLIKVYDPKIADAAESLFRQLKVPTEKHLVKQSHSEDPLTRIQARTDSFQRKVERLTPAELSKMASKSKNPQFKEAVDVLVPQMQKLGGDLHFGNWMVRLTGSGPQLVVIDPFVASHAQLN